VTTRRYAIQPRGLASARVRLMVPLLSVLAALVVGAGFLALTGHNPWSVYSRMVDTAFGSGRGFAETLVSATPLILTGVAAAVAFKMLVWNIGGEGQLLIGAIAAAGIGILMGDGVPAAIALPTVILAGAVGGAFWAIPDAARIPEFFHRLDYGLFVAIGVAILAWALIGKTRWGFELRVVGDSADTARYAGIGVPRKVLGVFLLSGAAAGLAGSLLVAGILGKMDPRSLDLGLGFTGIIVAALARLNPVAVIPVGVLMGALNNAGPALQSIQVPSATVKMLQGAILIFAVAGEFLIANRIRNVRKEEVPGLPPEEAAAT
jgi:ABC-type uncharacterized transport system permease subunit